MKMETNHREEFNGNQNSGPVEISHDNNIIEQMTVLNSANFLCKFTDKLTYLIEYIRDMAIKLRYVEEKKEYLHLPDFQTLTFPMCCFCDIPLSKLSSHMITYGKYGLALKKKDCIKKDIQPICYINRNAQIATDISEACAKLVRMKPIKDDYSFLLNILMTQLMYMKPITGYMQRGEDMEKPTVFIDECEWRYIPTMPNSMPLFLPRSDNTIKGRNVYSAALAKYKETWFTFDIDQIDYIIVPSEPEADVTISAIANMKGKSKDEKYKLISKIEVATKFKEDLITTFRIFRRQIIEYP